MGSNGWACNFVRRHGLKMRRCCGEGGDANEASAELARHSIPRLLAQLGARQEEVFNCDETGIIFGAHPKRTLAPTSVKGTKRDMDRLTLLPCCNVTSRKRLKPLIRDKIRYQRNWRARRVPNGEAKPSTRPRPTPTILHPLQTVGMYLHGPHHRSPHD